MFKRIKEETNMNINLQYFGGRGSAGGNRLIEAQNERIIDRTSFVNEGGGQWTLDIEGVGGGQILDERDSSRAGFGSGPAYGITVWDANNNSSDQQIYYGSLNEAKQELKRRLKNL